MIALHVENLTLIRTHRVLFRDLAFSVGPGSALAIEGPNGAGKTSLLRLIAGFLEPAGGTIRLRTEAGEISDGEERSGFVAWLGHQDATKPQMSVREQLSFFARLYDSKIPVGEALDAFGLSALAGLPGQFLSAGQKRRLALARLKLSGRALWLLDEPLAALDAAGKALVGDAIRKHCAAHGIVLAATHESLGVDCEKLVLGAGA